jgi:hypothetical protein
MPVDYDGVTIGKVYRMPRDEHFRLFAHVTDVYQSAVGDWYIEYVTLGYEQVPPWGYACYTRYIEPAGRFVAYVVQP